MPGSRPAASRRVTDPVRAYPVMRTVQALERLAFTPMSGPELAQALQVHPRTARRLLVRLAIEGYITQPTGYRRRHHLTLRLAALGRQAVANIPWLHAAAPSVAELATRAGHPAGLWIPCYSDVVCVLRAEPTGPLPEPALGELAPAHASAPGKALLAQRTAWRESILAEPLKRPTDGTLIDTRDLAAELARIRALGYATDHSANQGDVQAIAAPVLLAGDAVAALTLSMAATPLTATGRDELPASVKSIAAALNAALERTGP